MTILDELRASGGPEVIIETIELRCQAWPESIFLCTGFEDHTATLEDSRTVTFMATAMDVALPVKDATASQTLKFAIENATGEAVRLVRLALDLGAEVRLIYRPYVSSDMSEPAESPVHMIAKSMSAMGSHVEVTAGFFDLIDTAFPRDVYDPDFSPGLKYIE